MYNLTNCDREPVHLPGKIQSYGYLLGIDADSKKISHVSENISECLGQEATVLLDSDYHIILEKMPHEAHSSQMTEMIENICLHGINDDSANVVVEINQHFYHVIFNMANRILLVELEEVLSSVKERRKINNVVRRIMAENDFETVLRLVVKEVKNLIGYDRVMVYKFLSDGSGKVIAEERNPEVESYMHLHFPESDIPSQARELYKINKTRLIADSFSKDPQILSHREGDLDLTHSKLRAVSPIHIEYLKNMGVRSSFSVSVVSDDKLWGLIACHHFTPKKIDFEIRQNTELLGEIISSVIHNKVIEEDKNLADKYTAATNRLQRQLITAESIPAAIMGKKTTLLDLTRAEGVVLQFGDQYYSKGTVPSQEFVQRLYSWFLLHHPEEDIFHSFHLTADFPEAEAFRESASGVFISLLSRETNDAIFWFKPEKKTTIHWAGKPEKIIEERKENGGLVYDIHPRKSFEEYSELITGTSRKWFREEIKAGTRIKQEILEAALYKSKELRELNEKLTHAYEELNTFSYTISHDLKTPLTVMKTNAQLLLREATNGSAEKLQKIIDNVDDVSFMMDEILNLTKISAGGLVLRKIDMANLLKRVILETQIAFEAYHTEVDVRQLTDIHGDPTMIYQLFSNIINNAVKYSSKKESPKVVINSYTENDRVIYTIQDNGIGIDNSKLPEIFDVFRRFSNTRGFKGNGVGLTIVKRIMEKHQGEIKIESTLGEGSTFYLIFKK